MRRWAVGRASPSAVRGGIGGDRSQCVERHLTNFTIAQNSGLRRGLGPEMQFRFSDCMLDTDRRELRRGSESVDVEPQVLDLLIYLVQNRDRVVSKDDVIASVWANRIVSDGTLTSRVYAARKAVGDSGQEQRLIRTIARKGLRFIGGRV